MSLLGFLLGAVLVLFALAATVAIGMGLVVGAAAALIGLVRYARHPRALLTDLKRDIARRMAR